MKKLLNIHKGIEKKKELDRNERAEAFVAEFKKISEKFELDFAAELQFTPNGIKPILRLVDKRMPEMKPWSEAKRENLATVSACKHKENDTGICCRICMLDKKNWHESGTGVTEDYTERTNAAIVKQEEIEAEEKSKRENLEEEKKADNAAVEKHEADEAQKEV